MAQSVKSLPYKHQEALSLISGAMWIQAGNGGMCLQSQSLGSRDRWMSNRYFLGQ